MRTTFIVSAGRIGIAVLFNLYNVDSAQHGNRKQYYYLYKVESVLKIPNVTGNKEINEVVWEWFMNARSKNIHISGPMVESEALAVAKSFGYDQFKASTGWSDSFKKRHNIAWNRVCGESKDVDESVVSEYKPKLLELISPCEPKNIYSADETDCFFGHYQQNHSQLREESVPGAKYPKKDLQCYCVRIWWEKWKSLS
jgi:hypothetical protein